MAEPIIDLLRERRLHKRPEVVAAANRTRKRTGTPEPNPRDPDALIKNYIARFTEISERTDPTAKARGLAILKQILHQRFVISPDPANFEGYFASQAKQARGLGVAYQEPSESDKEQRIQSIITEQRNSLDVWVDYLASDESNYPPEQKYIALSSILKMGVYNPDKHTFSTRYKKTYKPFPDLDSEALGTAMTQIESGETEDFSSAYGEALFQVLHQRELLTELAEQGEQIEGEWRCYQQGSDYQQLMRDTAGKGSGWCFATNEYDARQYTNHGDQWIYFTPGTDGQYTVPRIGISVRDGQIFEARGVAKGQAMEGSMADINQQKLQEFPGHEQYAQRTNDTKQLAAIDHKVLNHEPLTKTDLAFLYQVDALITTFGRGKDARIADCLIGRDLHADMLTIFDCTEDQIAHTPAEIRPDTKAYVGSLVHRDKDDEIIPIFQRIGHLEHIYIQFPEKKIRRTQIEIGGKTKTQLEAEIQAKHISVASLAADIMGKAEFTTTADGQPITLVRLTIADLGFPNGCTTTQLLARREELGLELCPAEAGPHYRLQYLDQPDGEYVSMGMEPITNSDRDPDVFDLYHDGDSLRLYARRAGPGDEWGPGYEVVFRLRSPAGEAGKVEALAA